MILKEYPIEYTAYLAAKELILTYEKQQATKSLPPEFVTFGVDGSVLRLKSLDGLDYFYYRDVGAWDVDFTYSRVSRGYVSVSSDEELRGVQLIPTTYAHWQKDNQLQFYNTQNSDEIPF